MTDHSTEHSTGAVGKLGIWSQWILSGTVSCVPDSLKSSTGQTMCWHLCCGIIILMDPLSVSFIAAGSSVIVKVRKQGAWALFAINTGTEKSSYLLEFLSWTKDCYNFHKAKKLIIQINFKINPNPQSCHSHWWMLWLSLVCAVLPLLQLPEVLECFYFFLSGNCGPQIVLSQHTEQRDWLTAPPWPTAWEIHLEWEAR